MGGVSNTSSSQGTASLRKALRIISEMAEGQDRGFRLTEIVGRNNLDPATAHRILACLVEERFLEKRPDKRYRLGRRIFELGLVANNIFTERTRAHEKLCRLAQSVNAAVVLSARSGNDTVYIDRVEGPETVSGLLTALGTRLPIGIGAGGVAMLAAMDDALADTMIAENSARYRRFGLTTVALLRRRVAAAKQQGYAVTESFYRPGFGGIGVIVPGSETRPELAISIVTTIGRLDRIEQLVRELAAAATEVSAAFEAG